MEDMASIGMANILKNNMTTYFIYQTLTIPACILGVFILSIIIEKGLLIIYTSALSLMSYNETPLCCQNAWIF